LPSLGPENVRYGGNTSCVEVRADDGTLLVLDAGTGLRRLGSAVGPEVRRVDILLTHLHLDHLQGIGFFDPLYREGLEVHVWGPASTTSDLHDRVLRYMSPPLFPIRLRDVPCQLILHDVPRGCFQIGGLVVTADYICHPGATIGYRVEEGGRSLAYLPDHEPALAEAVFPGSPEWTPGFDLAAGVDVLIHDCQYSAVEYPEHVGWGHSAIDHAIALAVLARVKRLVTFHHDPGHDDVMLDRMLEAAVAAAEPPFPVVAGTEGASFRVGD
jgi:phosphoribosyl 1,2-cyclic phosphodiesterase